MDKMYKIHDNLQHHDKYKPKKLEIPPVTKFDEMKVNEVTQIIQLMATKSCEFDPIPAMVLKRFHKDLAPIITRIVNISLQTGTFAMAWKTSIIWSLLKKDGLDLILANYRPVSNLSFISKVIEKSMMSQFEKHCNKHQLILDYQSAYHSNYTIKTALANLTNEIVWGFESQQASALIVMDLSAAFDTIDYNILIEILENCYGLKGTVLE